jgi:hypothetical protein
LAVGPTEVLNSGFLQLSTRQVEISNRVQDIMQTLMEANKSARINPSSAIPPANQGRSIVDAGIGSSIDFNA